MAALPGFELLHSLEFQEGQKFASFEDSKKLLSDLGNPQDAYKTIHIAGTNGKGSVSAMLNGILMSNGSKVGVTTSPHLGQVTERCLINGLPVSDEIFSDSVIRVHNTAELSHRRFTYFVITLSAAFEIFRQEQVDWAVIECGLGGTLDISNAIAEPRATVITTVDLDHTEILGSTVRSIAENKAGIAKRNVPLIVGAVAAEAESVIRERCAVVGAPCFVMGKELSFDSEFNLLQTPWGDFNFKDVELPLHGQYQKHNAALAVAVGLGLGVPVDDIADGLQRVCWPGRLELVGNVLLDVAHNPSGIRSLVEYLSEFVPGRFNSVSFLVSILGRKDWHGMLDELKNFKAARWGFTRSVHPAALSPDVLCAEFGGGEKFDSASEGLATLSAKPGLVVVTGSSFIVGECRMKLVTEPFAIYRN